MRKEISDNGSSKHYRNYQEIKLKCFCLFFFNFFQRERIKQLKSNHNYNVKINTTKEISENNSKRDSRNSSNILPSSQIS